MQDGEQELNDLNATDRRFFLCAFCVLTGFMHNLYYLFCKIIEEHYDFLKIMELISDVSLIIILISFIGMVYYGISKIKESE